MRYASVCSGVEAASLAWGKLGWTPVFFAEVEPFPCAVLQQRFNATKPIHPLDPAEASDEKDRKMRESWLKQINKLPDTGIIPNLGDFTKIKGEDYVGAIDLLVGGTPCQDLSVAGKRAGFEGARSSLALDFVRLAYEARCQYFVWENVPGVFSSNRGGDFATLLSLFCGYTVDVPKDGWKSSGIVKNRRPDRYGLAWRVLDAQFTRVPGFPFAVPQRRRRVFLVGCLGDWQRAASILLEPDRLSWDTPPRIKTREEVAGSSGDCTAKTVNRAVEFAQDCANTVEASCYKGPCGTWNERTIVSQFWNGEQVAESLTTTSNNQRMPDKGRLQAIFTLDADSSNSMKSANPNSGIHEADVAKTLDTTVPTPQKAQGGQMIVGGFIGRQGSGSGSVGYEENVAPTQRSGLTTDVVCFHGSQDPISNGTNANAIGRNGGLENCICYDAQGVNNGQISGTITGDHNNRVTDYTQLVQNVSPALDSSMYVKNQTQDAAKYAAVAIAENVIGRKVENGGNGIGAQDELAYTQNATGVMGVCTKGNGDAFLSDVHTSLSASGGGQAGQGYPAALQQKTVRRLLPVEAERLMGHPDNHTRISWQGKPESECPDAPRYKAEGNSMAVNCMEWIGRRIEEFDR